MSSAVDFGEVVYQITQEHAAGRDLMIEIPDAQRRRCILGGLGGIEEIVSLLVGADRIMSVPEADQDRRQRGQASHLRCNPPRPDDAATDRRTAITTI